MNRISGDERDALLLDILKRLDVATPRADSDAWERNWEEALRRFRADPSDDALVPSFIRDQPVRENGAFWTGISELDYVRGLQHWLSVELGDCENIHEFGCGTGFNLVALAKAHPGKAFVGCDRSTAAARLVNEAAEHLKLSILAGVFDMLQPHGQLPRGAGVFTFGAMEQLGDFKPFIDWLIAQRPAKVVHIEPIPELLDQNNLLDWLSLQFHKKRGYTVGLLPYLMQNVNVIHAQRSRFGSLMLESYARIVWRPA